MAKGPVTTSGKPITTAPEPGKVMVKDADGNEQWVWPVDAREIALAAEGDVQVSTKVSEHATRPSTDQAIEKLLPDPEPEPEIVSDEGETGEGQVKTLRGPLHDDFPGKKALDEAGHNTYAKVRKLVAKGEGWHKGDEGVPGIGDATAAQIDEVFKKGD